jgi:hypothetical protein
MTKVIAAIVIFIAAFIVWRWTSVARGARKRDEKLATRIDPIGKKLDAGESVSTGEVEAMAARPEVRHMLFTALRQMGRSELVPSNYSSSVAQGESALAYWLMHPNELQDAPESIELVETIKRAINGQDADFHVYRFRMTTGHWAAKEGWLLGLAGPMPTAAEPYSNMPGAFSRAGDIEGKVKPAELVDWYVDMLCRKGLITNVQKV